MKNIIQQAEKAIASDDKQEMRLSLVQLLKHIRGGKLTPIEIPMSDNYMTPDDVYKTHMLSESMMNVSNPNPLHMPHDPEPIEEEEPQKMLKMLNFRDSRTLINYVNSKGCTIVDITESHGSIRLYYLE